MRTLTLTLSKQPFDVMVTGEKKKEFREQKPWVMNRLIDLDGNHKIYDVVKYINGYGHDRPYFIAVYHGFNLASSKETHTYSNGLKVEQVPGDVIINHGVIIERGNVKNEAGAEWYEKLPHKDDPQAVSGYGYVGDSKTVIEFYEQICITGKIHCGTNFDLSRHLHAIDRETDLMLLYDFLHRIMIYYWDPEKRKDVKILDQDDFIKLIGL